MPHEKGTSNLETVAMPLPSKIVLSMGQHIGAPAAPAVAKGDQVYVGTVVGKAGGFVSADIHSGVSGTVTEITTITAPNGAAQQAVVITPDGQQTVDPSIAPPQVTDMKSFVDAVRASGLVGLGGAGFPTAVKLSPKNLDEIDMLVINGAECEPYITSDNRCFIEDTHHVLNGIKQVMKYLNIAKCVIGIEGNKPEAIAKMKSAIDDPAIEVKTLPCRYPQGAEKVLIETCTGREVPFPGLPSDVGVIVMNVTSVAFVSKYLETGMPLTTKRLTVDGDIVKQPKNVEVIIGTPHPGAAGLLRRPHRRAGEDPLRRPHDGHLRGGPVPAHPEEQQRHPGLLPGAGQAAQGQQLHPVRPLRQRLPPGAGGQGHRGGLQQGQCGAAQPAACRPVHVLRHLLLCLPRQAASDPLHCPGEDHDEEWR